MKKFLTYLLLLVVLGVSGWAIFATSFVYSDGYRVGTLIKITKKGYLFKTWEGQLNLGGFSSENENSLSTTWDFSVLKRDAPVVEDINKAVEGAYKVKLHYNEMPYQFFWRGDTKYFVYKMEVIKGRTNNGNSGSNFEDSAKDESGSEYSE